MDYKTKCQEVFGFAQKEVERQGGLSAAYQSIDFLTQVKQKCQELFIAISAYPAFYNQFKINKPKMLGLYGHSITSEHFLESLKKALSEGKVDSFTAEFERFFVKPLA